MAGTDVLMDTKLGRVVVATRSFAVGELVMSEQPLLVFESNHSYLRAFTEAPPHVQASVLDMFHPPLDKDTLVVAMRRNLAHDLDGIFGLQKEVIHKLLMIRDTNCHSYTGYEEAYSEVIGTAFGGMPDRSTKAALFDRGSKVAHSCCPNVTYSSKTRQGGLVYIAVRPISEGEMVTYSYIDDLWTSTTRERQAKTLMEKDFVCDCTRCAGLDTTRAVYCPKKSCAGFANPLNPIVDQTIHSPWVCTVCGALDDATMLTVLQLECRLQVQLDELQAEGRRGSPVPPNLVRSVAERAAKGLSPAHRLVARSYDTVATLCASHAAASQRTGGRNGSTQFGGQVKMRMEAAEAAEKHAKVCECIAVGCQGGTQCAVPHPAVFQCTKAVFHAAQDLMQVPHLQRSSGALEFVARYTTHMTTMFGEADTDIVAVKQMIRAGGESS